MDGQIDHLLFEDESMIRDYQAIGRTWFLRFLEKLLSYYPAGKIVLVLDNA